MAEGVHNKTWLKKDKVMDGASVIDEDAEEVARNAAVVSISSSVVQRVTASPRQVKTQIAKISYVPANPLRLPKSPRKEKRTPPPQIFVQRLQTETPLTTPHSEQTTGAKTITIQEEEFHKKKDERDKEIQEIQNMLNEITKSPQKPSLSAEVVVINEKQIAAQAADATNEEIIEVKSVVATNSSAFRRSKTETHFDVHSKAATTRREITRNNVVDAQRMRRSRSSQPPPTKSNELLPDPVCGASDTAAKKKSYDPVEARRFMEEQKRKRRSNPNAAAGLLQPFKREKSALEREQIKKRLEDLRRNSRQIVNKNLKKKQAEHLAEPHSPRMDVLFRMSATQRKVQNKNAEVAADTAVQAKKRDEHLTATAAAAQREDHQLSLQAFDGKSGIIHEEVAAWSQQQGHDVKSVKLQVDKERAASVAASKQPTERDPKDERLQVQTAQESTPPRTQKGSATTRTIASSITSSVRSAPPHPPLTENQHKRIGLLRKPELKDHSFSAIKEFSFDKENVALEMMTPQFTLPQEARIKEKMPPSAAATAQAASSTENTNTKDNKEVKTSSDGAKDLHFDMPSTHLKPRPPSVREKATEVTPSLSGATKKSKTTKSSEYSASVELPYWLKPSAVQIYPYNFIMAVRRKLEAIANPMPAAPTVATTREYAFSTKNQTTSTGDLKRRNHETPLSSVPKERIAEAQQKVKRRIGMENCSVDSATTTAEDDDDENDKANETDDSFTTHIVKNHKSASTENFKIQKSISTDNLKIKKESTAPKASTEHVYRSQTTLSDFHSNFSSISIQLPASNTVSEVSSLKSESIRYAESPSPPKHRTTKSKASVAAKRANTTEDDDNTTVSSSIFNSPEKKIHRNVPQTTKCLSDDFKFVEPRPVSPLSLARIEKLKVRSKSKPNQAIVSKHVTAEESGAPESIAETAKTETRNDVSAVDEVGINFNQLLDDFNRSLSQVIQVNEQLKSTLDKSHQIFSPENKSHNASDDKENHNAEYTTDFEESSQKDSAHKDLELSVKKRAEDMQYSLRQRKRNLFELTNAVKPLLTSPRSDDPDSANDTSNKNVPNQQLDLNFKSLTNSSVNSASITAAEAATPESSQHSLEINSSPKSFEKRLLEIEKLKVNLKQTICHAKASRSGDELQQENKSKTEILPDENKTNSRRQHNSRHNTATNSHDLTVSEALEKSQSTSNTPQKLANLSKHAHKSQLYITNASTKQPTQAESSPGSNQNSSIASNQSPISKLTSKSENNSSSTAAAAQQHHNDSASNSPNGKTFQMQTHSNMHSNSNSIFTQKSSAAAYDESRSITEELQNAHESPSKENTNGNPKISQPSSPEKKHRSHRSLDTHSEHDAFVRTHINISRGDFQPDLNENAVSNESHFQAAIKEAATAGNVDADNSSSTASLAPPSYHFVAPGTQKTMPKLSSQANATIGSEIAAIFNLTDFELSIMSSNNDVSLSESSLNYSNIGLYEKLIQTETTKSEHLTALLKMREKALLDRTKGQIAWLEVQKERYKAKGLLDQITAIKKKQRGILLKVEKEREEIKRLLQSTTSTSTQSSARQQALTGTSTQTSPSKRRKTRTTSPTVPPLALLPPPLPLKSTRSTCNNHQQQHPKSKEALTASTVRSAPIIRADYKLESSRSLEELLQRRESDLRKRREHVERLMQWHQRLDQEEAEVLQLEHMLLNYNNEQAATATSPTQAAAGKEKSPTASISPTKKHSSQTRHNRSHKMERRLKEIDKSLRELSSISASNTTINDESAGGGDISVASLHESNVDFVRTTGSKLNKLWRRLTSQQVEKFESNRRYKLCKSDLERLYEEAKIAVLRDFAQDEERIAAELLERSEVASNSSGSRLSTSAAEKFNVPHLNLNFSSATSDADEGGNCGGGNILAATVTSTTHALPQGNYSPSAAEEDFQLQRFSADSNESSCSVSKSSVVSVESKSSDLSKKSTPASDASITLGRKQLIERNVAKFLARSQHLLNKSANDGLLHRSHSDTEIVAPHDSTHLNVATSQRNIAILRHEKCSTASIKMNDKNQSPCSSDTLKSVQSLNTQNSAASQRSSCTTSISSLANAAENIPTAATSTLQQSDNDVQIFAKITESSVVSPTHSTKSHVTKQTAESRENTVKRSCGSATNSFIKSATGSTSLTEKFVKSHTDSKRIQTASRVQSLESQTLTENVTKSPVKSAKLSAMSATNISLTLTDEIVTNSNAACVQTLENVTNSSVKSANSVVKSNEIAAPNVSSIVSAKTTTAVTGYVDISQAANTASATTITSPVTLSSSKSTLASQQSDSERQAREISAKLEQISLAVSQLSHANALPSYQSTNTAATEISTPTPSSHLEDDSSNIVISEEELQSSAAVDVDASSYSYSCHFENISTDMQSPSGCTLKGSSSNDAKSQSKSLSNRADEEEESPVNATDSVVSPSATFITSAQLTLQSKTFTSSDTPKETSFSQSVAENRILDVYEADFELSSGGGGGGDETCLDELSMPQFETTIETTQEEENEETPEEAAAKDEVVANSATTAASVITAEATISNKELLPPPPLPPPAATANVAGNNSHLMPDIINELEIRRCQQILLENEHLKQYEHVTAVPYMYVREIPNKPPPPYVPPAHGSPMTTIFPSEERIKDITYRRTHELYCENLKTDYANAKGDKLTTVAEEKITNIYERIILDICREYLDEHREVLSQGDPTNFHSQLAFFNPPDRLRCIQQSIYKEVRRCLAMDKTPPKRTQVYSVYGQRAKRDHIGKIIIQEMYDEDDQWCNFHREENEVLELIVEEMLAHEVRLLAGEVFLAEGGTLTESNEDESEEQAVEMITLPEDEVGEYSETVNESESAAATPKSLGEEQVLEEMESSLTPSLQ